MHVHIIVPDTVAVPPAGINVPVADDFPTSFSVPSRRLVRCRLAAQSTGIMTPLFVFASTCPLSVP
jgi:hypothetical protein